MEQAADGMMMEEPVALGGEGPETGRAFEGLEAGDQPPSAALVAADDRPARAQPASRAAADARPGSAAGGRGAARRRRAGCPRPVAAAADDHARDPGRRSRHPPSRSAVRGRRALPVRRSCCGSRPAHRRGGPAARSRSSPGRRRPAGPRRAAARTRRGRHRGPRGPRSCRGSSGRTPRPGHRPRGTDVAPDRSVRECGSESGNGRRRASSSSRRQVGMLEEPRASASIRSSGNWRSRRLLFHRGANLGHRLDRPNDRQTGRQLDQPPEPRHGRRIRDLVQQDRVGSVRGSSAGGTTRYRSRGTRPPRRPAGPAPGRSAAGRRDARTSCTMSRRPGCRASLRPPRVRRPPPPGRTGRGRAPPASARRRGAGPAGRSPVRPPPWPSGRRGSGNAGLASSDGSTRPASPGRPPRVPARSRWSPGPVAGAGHLRLAVSRDGARWHSSGPRQTGDRAHPGPAHFDTSRRDRAGIPPLPPRGSPSVPTETRRPASATVLEPRSRRREDRNKAPVSGAGMMHSCVRWQRFYGMMRGDRHGRA